MNFWQRAWKNVSRRKTKSLLLLITFFVIGNFVIVGLGVSSAAETAKVLTRKKMRAVVTYGIDYDKVREFTSAIEDEDELTEFYRHKFPHVSVSDVQEILKDKRVKTANALTKKQGYSVDKYDYVHLNNKAEDREKEGGNEQCSVMPDGTTVCTKYVSPSLGIKGNHFPDMIELSDGTYTIESGRFYSQEDIDKKAKVVVVSKAFAEVNNLHIGDSFSFSLADPNDIAEKGPLSGLKEEEIRLNLEVIGIYTNKEKITPDMPDFEHIGPSENPDNTLLIPATTVEESMFTIALKRFTNAKENPGDDYYGNPENAPKRENFSNLGDVTILLEDPLQVDSFVEEYMTSLGDFKKLSANNDEFNRLSKPLDTLSLYSNFIVWLVVINAVVIITLVTALTLKTREFEIGVLLSIGASKAKVIGQFFMELAIVAVLGFTLSIASGSLVANQVGKQVLDYQISSSDNLKGGKDEIHYQGFYSDDYTTEISIDDLVAEYSVNVSPLIIAEIYVVGLGIVLISTLIPSMMIMRFNPKKILMNQN